MKYRKIVRKSPICPNSTYIPEGRGFKWDGKLLIQKDLKILPLNKDQAKILGADGFILYKLYQYRKMYRSSPINKGDIVYKETYTNYRGKKQKLILSIRKEMFSKNYKWVN